MQDIEQIVKKQREFFESNATKSLEFRLKALNRIDKAVSEYESEIKKALKEDLNKSHSESFMTEIALVKTEIRHIKRYLHRWMDKRPALVTIPMMPGDSYSVAEPLGVVLVMSPWNYPILLGLVPLVDAIAAGNCVILKTSESAPASGKILDQMFRQFFPGKLIEVVEGSEEINQKILDIRYDYIFFTGGKRIGKMVMEKAARFLTPVTLELGGKSPCIVDKSADLELAARRIIFGKLLNAGQTCVAPDYVLADQSVEQELVTLLTDQVREMLGEDPLNNKDYPRIINHKHYERLTSMLEGSKILAGGRCNRDTLQIEPTILGNPDLHSPVMSEEIFGPVLPILPYENRDEIKSIISRYDKPLAVYLFSQDKDMEEWVVNEFSFGGGCINNTIMQITSPYLPFGGVGGSGMGSYHGRYGFETFSHRKSVVRNWVKPDIPVRYQPYNNKKDKLIKWFSTLIN